MHRIRDGVLVVHHEAKVGPFHDPAPTLDQVIALAKAGRTRVDVELKARGSETMTVDRLLGSVDASRFVIKSFHRDLIGVVKQARPQVRATARVDGRRRRGDGQVRG